LHLKTTTSKKDVTILDMPGDPSRAALANLSVPVTFSLGTPSRNFTRQDTFLSHVSIEHAVTVVEMVQYFF